FRRSCRSRPMPKARKKTINRRRTATLGSINVGPSRSRSVVPTGRPQWGTQLFLHFVNWPPGSDGMRQTEDHRIDRGNPTLAVDAACVNSSRIESNSRTMAGALFSASRRKNTVCASRLGDLGWDVSIRVRSNTSSRAHREPSREAIASNPALNEGSPRCRVTWRTRRSRIVANHRLASDASGDNGSPVGEKNRRKLVVGWNRRTRSLSKSRKGPRGLGELTKRARGASPTRKSIMRRLVHRKTKAIRARLVGPTTARYTRTQERPGSGARRMIQASAPKPTASTIAVNNITNRRRRAHSDRKVSIDSGARVTDSRFPGRFLR